MLDSLNEKQKLYGALEHLVLGKDEKYTLYKIFVTIPIHKSYFSELINHKVQVMSNKSYWFSISREKYWKYRNRTWSIINCSVYQKSYQNNGEDVENIISLSYNWLWNVHENYIIQRIYETFITYTLECKKYNNIYNPYLYEIDLPSPKKFIIHKLLVNKLPTE